MSCPPMSQMTSTSPKKCTARHHVRDGLDDVHVGAHATPRARRRRSRWRRSRCTSSVAPWSVDVRLAARASSSFVSWIGLPLESWYSLVRMLAVLVDQHRLDEVEPPSRPITRAHAPARLERRRLELRDRVLLAERVELVGSRRRAAGRPISPSCALRPWSMNSSSAVDAACSAPTLAGSCRPYSTAPKAA